jgi:hypothetical protein
VGGERGNSMENLQKETIVNVVIKYFTGFKWTQVVPPFSQFHDLVFNCLLTTFTLVSLPIFLSMGKKQVYGRCGTVGCFYLWCPWVPCIRQKDASSIYTADLTRQLSLYLWKQNAGN